MNKTIVFDMKTKMLTLAMAAFSLLACKNEPMKPQAGYIGPSDIKVEDGRMSPEVLLSFGRLSDPQLSPDGKTILYARHADGWIPVSNGLSARISKDLKKRGFKFLGPTTVYSHLQACGIINDHSKDCPCYAAINAANPTVHKRADAEVGVAYFGD